MIPGLGAVTPRRAATVVAGVGLIVAGRYVGGYLGAAIIGGGIGLGAIGIGRREPHLFRRRPPARTSDEAPDELPEEW